MTTQPFSGEDYEFAVGGIKGLRSWNHDEQGRLHGVTHKEVWRPGENVAVCKKVNRVPCPNLNKRAGKKADEVWHHRMRATYGITFETNAFEVFDSCGEATCYGGQHDEPIGHDFDADCKCGFWAYDEANFSAHGDVTGVIEGFGKTTIGTKGFRAEKARIVALSRESQDGDLLSLSLWLRLQHLYAGAEFFTDYERMLTTHGGVLRTWDAVGEDFWDVPPSPSKRQSSLYNYLQMWGPGRGLGSLTFPGGGL